MYAFSSTSLARSNSSPQGRSGERSSAALGPAAGLRSGRVVGGALGGRPRLDRDGHPVVERRRGVLVEGPGLEDDRLAGAVEPLVGLGQEAAAADRRVLGQPVDRVPPELLVVAGVALAPRLGELVGEPAGDPGGQDHRPPSAVGLDRDGRVAVGRARADPGQDLGRGLGRAELVVAEEVRQGLEDRAGSRSRRRRCARAGGSPRRRAA